MWCAYVLKSLKDGRCYIGSTNNIERRLEEHNSGHNRSTRNRRPLQLVYLEKFENRVEALRREKKIKSYKGGEAFKKLIKDL